MGCDIHMFVEKINPVTRRWDKIGNVFFYDYYIDKAVEYMGHNLGLTEDESEAMVIKYFKGGKPSSKIEDFVFNNFFPDLFSENFEEVWGTGTKLPDPRTDQPYMGRNYNLFGALAGVRNDDMELIADMDRGLPDDVSDEICAISDEWDMDGHSHNYLYLDEILNSSYTKMTQAQLDEIGVSYFFNKVIPTLVELADNPSEIRLVFWFDN